MGAWGAGDSLCWGLILCYWGLDSRNGPGPWAAGSEGCVRWERCALQALPGGTGASLCLRPASGKGEGGCHPLSSCSPSGCCSELPFTVCTELNREHMISLSPASAWEMDVKSSWSGLDICLRGLATVPLLTRLGYCGSLHHPQGASHSVNAFIGL